jgi:hypothetical protein
VLDPLLLHDTGRHEERSKSPPCRSKSGFTQPRNLVIGQANSPMVGVTSYKLCGLDLGWRPNVMVSETETPKLCGNRRLWVLFPYQSWST